MQNKKANQENYKQYILKYQSAENISISNSHEARARLNMLLDPGSYFLELSKIAGFELYKDIISAGVITGIGLVTNKPCMIIINNPENKAGCYFPITVKKIIRALEIAENERLPCLHLVDSGGAYLPMQAELFANAEGFGRIFYQQARLKKLKISQFAAILGSCTAGGAYVPVMADACTMVKKKGSLFLAGPPLVAAATGEKLSKEELGGTKVHCYKSAVVDHESNSIAEAILWLRNQVSRLSFTKQTQNNYQAPKQKNDITQFIEHDTRFLPDIEAIIATIVDGSEFDEFQANIGKSLRTGWASIYGHKIAIIANDGILSSDAMQKATKFIALAEKCKSPLLFLHNTHGMQVGARAELSGIASHGARLIETVANTTLAKYTIMIGCSYGAGNYAMSGRAYNPNFLFQWPNNKTAVMGAAQQQHVLKTIGKELKVNADNHCAIYHSARLNDDGIIMPNATRDILGFILNLSQQDN